MRFASIRPGAGALDDLKARRFLCAGTPATPPARGQLREVIDEAVELALAMRGALPPRASADAALEAVIADQVFRALALGAAGLAIEVPGLANAAGDRGALDAGDSATLAAWLDAARSSPVALVLQDADRAVRVLTPIPLAELAADAAPPAWGAIPRKPAASLPEPATRAVAEAEVAASDLGLAGVDPHRAAGCVAAAEIVASDLSEALGAAALRVDIQLGSGGEVDEVVTPSSRERPHVPKEALGRVDARPRGVLPPRALKGKLPQPPAAARDAASVAAPAAPAAPLALAGEGEKPGTSGASARGPAPAAAGPRAQPACPAERWMSAEARTKGGPAAVEAALASEAARREPRATPQGRAVSAAEWRSLALELDENRGPKPVRTIEHLFTSRYVPLLNAVLAGEADGAVRGVVDAWRSSFERSYREAFSSLRVTGKRPPMVLDAPDIAARIARLNGARGVKLVLVDAMRFDLGERVAARLQGATAGRAVLVERALLWAALPTTTAAQLALIARGPEGLREEPPGEPEPEIARGRAVGTLRRERTGNRELMKLDLVEARLRNAGPPFAERMDAVAEEVTEVIARFLEALPPRTLVLVFGDHGFRIAPLGDGTGPATQGGGSPEEVLLPAHAWLVGGVH